MKQKKLGKARVQSWRKWIQIGFFVLVAFIATMNGLAEIGITLPAFLGGASLHAICPFGGVVSFWNLATLGTLVKKVHDSSVVLAVLGLFLALLFGPVICGWICPFGTFQEWIGKIGRKIFKKRYNHFVPTKLDKILRYARYLVLAWVSYMTVITGKLIFQDVDPYYALFNFWRSEVAISGFVILGIVMVLSLFVERPFCKYACPYGAFQGLFNFFRIFKIKRNETTCISCNACSRSCPMNIDVAHGSVVHDHQCISCMQCTSETACPVQNTVEFVPLKAKKSMHLRTLGITASLILLGGIGFSMLLGLWNVESSKQPALIKEGEFAGLPSPSDIRGSYSWADVSKAFDIPVQDVTQAFGATSSEEKVNSLEALYLGKLPEGVEIGTDSVRLFVSLYTGLPHTIEDGTILPTSAISLLEARGKTTAPDFASIASNAVSISQDTPLQPILSSDATVPSIPSGSTVSITGKTTFKELLDAGYALQEIEAIVGKVTNLDMAIKDFVSEQGTEFSEVKAKLAELLPQ
ncbi:4Fe-4S binding protein [uncultured Sphaerochaeta sp.]|uniref:4Fe-4S binding protein n=1 Tax=uncultured Sphaerochaeta sp. TaxID=886478 RepID=UPI002A0A604A|nr:4Fe-4S binding protein [uncultured Sphaerochaeta sp.]